MRLDVLQTVALCSYGNAFLSGKGDEDAPELLGANAVFRGVKELEFVRIGPAKSPIRSAGTATWLTDLKALDATSLTPLFQSCSIVASRQGADPWGLIAQSERGCEVWQPSVKLPTTSSGGSHQTRVTFNAARYNPLSIKDSVSYDEASDKLLAALKMTIEFFSRYRQASILGPLNNCVSLHHSGSTELIGFTDLLHPAFHVESRALIASALRVFLLFQSGIWENTPLKDDLRLEQVVNRARLWHASLLAFEVGCSIGLQTEAPTSSLVFRRHAS